MCPFLCPLLTYFIHERFRSPTLRSYSDIWVSKQYNGRLYLFVNLSYLSLLSIIYDRFNDLLWRLNLLSWGHDHHNRVDLGGLSQSNSIYDRALAIIPQKINSMGVKIIDHYVWVTLSVNYPDLFSFMIYLQLIVGHDIKQKIYQPVYSYLQ